jgi:regulator of protease activity HflC (stomatin/prohibitin superfamily)
MDMKMQEQANDLLTGFIALGVILAAWFAIAAWLRGRKAGFVTVYDYETGLKYVAGKLVEALPPGRYNTWSFANDTLIERVDLREQTFAVAGQEVLSQDNLPVRVTVVVRWRIGDAVLQKRTSANPATRLYEAVQVFLRQRIGAVSLDALLADREQITAGALAALEGEAAKAGLVLIAVDTRDFNLVGAAKQAYADLWRAQKEGLAALERARGEQAALRSLANAARMLKGNPELMNLRVLQALQGQSGKSAPSVILGGAPGLVPVSKDPAPDGEAS